jgi:stress response protein SCP2
MPITEVNPTPATPLPTPFLPLTDEQFETFKESLNNAIHELVFAVQHMDQGDFEDVQNALQTAKTTIETVSETYETLRKTEEKPL